MSLPDYQFIWTSTDDSSDSMESLSSTLSLPVSIESRMRYSTHCFRVARSNSDPYLFCPIQPSFLNGYKPVETGRVITPHPLTGWMLCYSDHPLATYTYSLNPSSTRASLLSSLAPEADPLSAASSVWSSASSSSSRSSIRDYVSFSIPSPPSSSSFWSSYLSVSPRFRDARQRLYWVFAPLLACLGYNGQGQGEGESNMRSPPR